MPKNTNKSAVVDPYCAIPEQNMNLVNHDVIFSAKKCASGLKLIFWLFNVKINNPANF